MKFIIGLSVTILFNPLTILERHFFVLASQSFLVLSFFAFFSFSFKSSNPSESETPSLLSSFLDFLSLGDENTSPLMNTFSATTAKVLTDKLDSVGDISIVAPVPSFGLYGTAVALIVSLCCFFVRVSKGLSLWRAIAEFSNEIYNFSIDLRILSSGLHIPLIKVSDIVLLPTLLSSIVKLLLVSLIISAIGFVDSPILYPFSWISVVL